MLFSSFEKVFVDFMLDVSKVLRFLREIRDNLDDWPRFGLPSGSPQDFLQPSSLRDYGNKRDKWPYVPLAVNACLWESCCCFGLPRDAPRIEQPAPWEVKDNQLLFSGLGSSWKNKPGQIRRVRKKSYTFTYPMFWIFKNNVLTVKFF